MASREEIVALYRRLYELTNPACARCEVECPRETNFQNPVIRCCEKVYCDKAARYAKEKWGVELSPVNPDIPFLGSSGCVVPPHLRPICTHHICRVDRLTLEQQRRYWEIRRQLVELEQALSLLPYPGDGDS